MIGERVTVRGKGCHLVEVESFDLVVAGFVGSTAAEAAGSGSMHQPYGV